DFLTKLAEGGVAHPGVRYTTIMTKYDEAVVPYSSGYLRTPNATQVILNALDPANAKPVRCQFVPVSP
ncbi:lipase, partial [Kibdelosporangium aridum]